MYGFQSELVEFKTEPVQIRILILNASLDCHSNKKIFDLYLQNPLCTYL